MRTYTSSFNYPAEIHYNVANKMLYVCLNTEYNFISLLNLSFSTEKELFGFLSILSHDNNLTFVEYF